MESNAEFAEQYSAKQAARRIALCLLTGVAIILVCQHYFFPWLNGFVASAPCRTVFGWNGMMLVWYGLFVVMPLGCGLLVGSVIGLRGYKILRDGQSPPRGEKVFRRTRITRGNQAFLVGVFQLLAFMPLLVLAVWGWGQAEQMQNHVAAQSVQCAAESSANPGY